MQRSPAKAVATGGIMAALAVVIMCLGGLIPVATFVCPMVCMMILQMVFKMYGGRIGWAWYAAVTILSLLLGPDKEAAAVFLFLGYYPMLKPWMDRRKLHWLFKVALFNAAILVMYWLLLQVFGMEEIAADYAELGKALTAFMLVVGNVCFVLLDICLSKFAIRK